MEAEAQRKRTGKDAGHPELTLPQQRQSRGAPGC